MSPRDRQTHHEDTRPRLALIVTDAYAFNTLSRGQLEFFRDNGIKLDLYCNGAPEQMDLLRQRQVGRVIRIPFRRQPHPVMDVVALCMLWWHLIRRRYSSVVYSTPKAMLLGSIAAFAALKQRRISIVRGRAYEIMTGAKRKFYLMVDRVSFALSHDVIFISHSLMQAYRKDGIAPKDKARILGPGSSNGVDLGRFQPMSPQQRAEFRRQHGLTDEHFIIVLPGRVVADKGVREALSLIDRLQDLPQLRWFFIGWPEDEALTAAIKAKVGQGVTHHDHTRRIQDWMGLADLAFLPTHREGFCNVAAEAAACGLPTLGFDVVGLRDSVAVGTTGTLVPFGDIEACEAYIRDAVDNSAAFKARFPNARKWVADRFDKQEVWQRYAKAFSGRALSVTD